MSTHNENGDLVPIDGQLPDVITGTGPVKKYLAALEKKGLRVCGDLQIVDGEVFLKDGTNMEGLVKDLEFIFKFEDQSGALIDDDGASYQDPATAVEFSDGSVGDWTVGSDAGLKRLSYLKITRPNGSIVEKPADGINRLEYHIDQDGTIESLAEVAQAIEALMSAAESVLGDLDADGNPSGDSNLTAARKEDVDVLEAAFDKYIEDLQVTLNELESNLRGEIDLRDGQIVNHEMGRLFYKAGEARNKWAADHLHAELDYTAVAATTLDFYADPQAAGAWQGAAELAPYDLDNLPTMLVGFNIAELPSQGPNFWYMDSASRMDISNWNISAVIRTVEDGKQLIKQESLVFKARIANGKLLVWLQVMDNCEHMQENDVICISAMYCGPDAMDSTAWGDQPLTHANVMDDMGSISNIGDGTIEDNLESKVFTHDDPITDSDSGSVASPAQKINPPASSQQIDEGGEESEVPTPTLTYNEGDGPMYFEFADNGYEGEADDYFGVVANQAPINIELGTGSFPELYVTIYDNYGDGWTGNVMSITLQRTGQVVTLTTVGPDGIEDTADDLLVSSNTGTMHEYIWGDIAGDLDPDGALVPGDVLEVRQIAVGSYIQEALIKIDGAAPPEPVPAVQGCTNEYAVGYDPAAEEDDGSCGDEVTDTFIPLQVAASTQTGMQEYEASFLGNQGDGDIFRIASYADDLDGFSRLHPLVATSFESGFHGAVFNKLPLVDDGYGNLMPDSSFDLAGSFSSGDEVKLRFEIRPFEEEPSSLRRSGEGSNTDPYQLALRVQNHAWDPYDYSSFHEQIVLADVDYGSVNEWTGLSDNDPWLVVESASFILAEAGGAYMTKAASIGIQMNTAETCCGVPDSDSPDSAVERAFVIKNVQIISAAEPVVQGCTAPDANNYDPSATESDGSCTWSEQLNITAQTVAFNRTSETEGTLTFVFNGAGDSAITDMYNAQTDNSNNQDYDRVIYVNVQNGAGDGTTFGAPISAFSPTGATSEWILNQIDQDALDEIEQLEGDSSYPDSIASATLFTQDS